MNLLSRYLPVLAYSLLISGCMTVEMPKNMVADAVDASVKAYDSVRGTPRDKATLEFAYTTVFDEAVSVKDGTTQCYERLAQHVRTEMNDPKLPLERVKDSISKYRNRYGVECRMRTLQA